MPSFQQFTSELIEKKYLNPKVIFLRLKLITPTEINFVAGQYVALIFSPSLRRSYSIFSTPKQKDVIDLIVDVTPGGLGTTMIKNMNVGQKIEFLGPLGKFVYETSPDENNIFFIVTGTGFSPAHSMILNLFRRGSPWRTPTMINLLYGCSYKADFVAWDELKQLEKDFSNFKFIPCISREVVAGEFKGRVTDYLSAMNIPYSHFFICGNRNMVQEVIDLLRTKNVLDAQISTEKY